MRPAPAKKTFLLLLLIITVLVVLPAHSSKMVIPWDPGIYVGWNDIIVQGRLVKLWDTEPREMPEFGGWSFRGQAGIITIMRAIYNKTDRVLECGDTLSFFLRTADTSEPRGSISRGVTDPGEPVNLPVGATGYYAFRVNDYRVGPGWEFFINEERMKEVEEFLANLEADSATTVRDLQRRHSFFRGRFLPVPQRARVENGTRSGDPSN